MVGEDFVRNVRLDRLGVRHPMWKAVIWPGFETPIRRHEVHRAVTRGDLMAPEDVPDFGSYHGEVPRAQHIRRIAYLAVHPTDDPVSLDVGCPCLGHRSSWWIEDGNHRVLAAAYRGAKTIAARVSGQESLIKWLCGAGDTEDLYQWY